MAGLADHAQLPVEDPSRGAWEGKLDGGFCILGSNLVEGSPDIAINPAEGVPVSI